jgi:hypothetical protein
MCSRSPSTSQFNASPHQNHDPNCSWYYSKTQGVLPDCISAHRQEAQGHSQRHKRGRSTKMGVHLELHTVIALGHVDYSGCEPHQARPSPARTRPRLARAEPSAVAWTTAALTRAPDDGANPWISRLRDAASLLASPTRMTLPRCVLPGQTVMVTRRCLRRTSCCGPTPPSISSTPTASPWSPGAMPSPSMLRARNRGVSRPLGSDGQLKHARTSRPSPRPPTKIGVIRFARDRGRAFRPLSTSRSNAATMQTQPSTTEDVLISVYSESSPARLRPGPSVGATRPHGRQRR